MGNTYSLGFGAAIASTSSSSNSSNTDIQSSEIFNFSLHKQRKEEKKAKKKANSIGIFPLPQQSQFENSFFERFPVEWYPLVLIHLHKYDFKTLSKTCKFFWNLLHESNEDMWIYLCRLKKLESKKSEENGSWKDIFLKSVPFSIRDLYKNFLKRDLSNDLSS